MITPNKSRYVPAILVLRIDYIALENIRLDRGGERAHSDVRMGTQLIHGFSFSYNGWSTVQVEAPYIQRHWPPSGPKDYQTCMLSDEQLEIIRQLATEVLPPALYRGYHPNLKKWIYMDTPRRERIRPSDVARARRKIATKKFEWRRPVA